jgi:hypothetical protein
MHRTPPADPIGQALATVHSVDIDPYAVLLTRYQLLALACRANGNPIRAHQAPTDQTPQVACADALLADHEPC